MPKNFIRILTLGTMLCASTGALAELKQGTEGQNNASPFLQEYGRTLPPIGHVGLCRRLPSECAPREEAMLERRIDLTDEAAGELRKINDLVNDMIEPVTDQELYGRIEHWTYPAGMGDCEDYVLLKRRLLMERGWPASSLLITVVRDENNDGHAILTVRTSEGDLILDNKRREILAWNASGYKFVKRQSRHDPSLWISLAAPTQQQMRNRTVSTNRGDR